MLIYLYFNNQTEKFGNTESSNVTSSAIEAVQNVAGLYNNNHIVVTNLTVLDKITTKNINATENVIAKNVTASENVKTKNMSATGTAEVTGNLTTDGMLTVKNGSRFTGGRHFFQDSENAGKLRVGAAWGIPGIYSESSNVVVGAAGGINLASQGSVVINTNGRDHLLIAQGRHGNPAGHTGHFFYINEVAGPGKYEWIK